jgi:hypothetical protein
MKTRKVARYFLWIALNGEEQAKSMLNRYHLSVEENLERLAHTGFLFNKAVVERQAGQQPLAIPVQASLT